MLTRDEFLASQAIYLARPRTKWRGDPAIELRAFIKAALNAKRLGWEAHRNGNEAEANRHRLRAYSRIEDARERGF